ncbi:hypothetical protein CHGG_02512 [Chaetomium globosum CBS 148.51]|uniref:Uncharacterized protein n=1 Tax=Chaetomium globosum (strain ATCC 6205 / CBS 148.51 / DSM 1962 / NBRC 6347 / NRRL 1970) TaxID=306901 RepID=Q2HB92_CHAGB|nr:uncharacterized protein CHGG_02512 [Chaetomium globosum CBS 148.51]EAQ90577.1 hypothetical protein CHGG_02512 [Chaetomium globosum CBS 148.51]
MSRVSLQSPLLQAVLRRPTAQLIPRCTLATTKPTVARSISHLPTLRPTLTTPSPLFRAANAQRFTPTTMSETTTTGRGSGRASQDVCYGAPGARGLRQPDPLRTPPKHVRRQPPDPEAPPRLSQPPSL